MIEALAKKDESISQEASKMSKKEISVEEVEVAVPKEEEKKDADKVKQAAPKSPRPLVQD